jgi:hypothetical protein
MKTTHALVALFLAAALAGPAAAAAPIQGEVLETRDVESYTYLRLATRDGEIWAAVPTAQVKKGDRVTIANPMVMQGFESKTLKRTFDKIVFGQLGAPGGQAVAASPHGAMPGAGAAPAPIKVAKATGPDARTVAEIVNGRAGLKDKPVTVHAQVVKVNNGIMGKNWLHLRDGTGTAADGSYDLVATTQDSAKVGDVVTVKGKVHTDVDVGAGYRFAVMIGDATIAR